MLKAAPPPVPSATGPKTPAELDREIDTAIGRNDWSGVALVLNAFSTDDIRSRVRGDARLTGRLAALMAGALDSMILWPPPNRVADAIYAAAPEAARKGRIDYIDRVLDTGRSGEQPGNFGAEKWKRAALALNGFNEDDIRVHLPRE